MPEMTPERLQEIKNFMGLKEIPASKLRHIVADLIAAVDPNLPEAEQKAQHQRWKAIPMDTRRELLESR